MLEKHSSNVSSRVESSQVEFEPNTNTAAQYLLNRFTVTHYSKHIWSNLTKQLRNSLATFRIMNTWSLYMSCGNVIEQSTEPRRHVGGIRDVSSEIAHHAYTSTVPLT